MKARWGIIIERKCKACNGTGRVSAFSNFMENASRPCEQCKGGKTFNGILSVKKEYELQQAAMKKGKPRRRDS